MNPAPVNGHLVLNVNDHPGVRYLTTRMLERAGYAVIEAETGHDALRRVSDRRPSLVVLDIKLPDVDGLELCRRIKSDPANAGTKVLHTSAIFVAPESKVQSLNSGADGYLSHPFEPEELIATARSLLRLVEAEQRLRDTAEELQAANQRIHEFLAMLGHELRNPLSAIATSLPLLESQAAAQGEPGRRAREVIRRQTSNLRRLVDDLLDAARVTQGKIEPRREVIDLVALLGRVCDNFSRGLVTERGQHLHLTMPDEPVLVSGDPLRLEQVFSNLVDNASKYTLDGGHIEVVLSAPRDGIARISVRDDGVGIPPEALPTIFKLFSQAEVPLARSRGGLGIGLTVVRSLVEMHGGRVSAASEGEGRGCIFEVELPRLAGRSTPEAQPEPCARSATRRRVALVEDNHDAQQMLKCLLELWGHEVRVASDGRAGLELIREFRPDVALVDIGLPLADGYEVARQLCSDEARRGLLLVALTGYGSPEQRHRAREAGFDLHLVKPVDTDALTRLLQGPEALERGQG